MIIEECEDWRDRVYSPAATLRLFLGQVLGEDRACQDLRPRLLAERTAEGVAAIGLNTGAHCQARQRLPLECPRSTVPGGFPRIGRGTGNWSRRRDAATRAKVDRLCRGQSLGTKDHRAVWRPPKRPDWMSVEVYERHPVEMVMRECEVDGRVLVTHPARPGSCFAERAR